MGRWERLCRRRLLVRVNPKRPSAHPLALDRGPGPGHACSIPVSGDSAVRTADVQATSSRARRRRPTSSRRGGGRFCLFQAHTTASTFAFVTGRQVCSSRGWPLAVGPPRGGQQGSIGGAGVACCEGPADASGSDRTRIPARRVGRFTRQFHLPDVLHVRRAGHKVDREHRAGTVTRMLLGAGLTRHWSHDRATPSSPAPAGTRRRSVPRCPNARCLAVPPGGAQSGARRLRPDGRGG